MPYNFHALLYFLRIYYLSCDKLGSFDVHVAIEGLRHPEEKLSWQKFLRN